MNTQSNAIMIIPARLASMRLPLKPLHLINGKPLIAHVIDRAKKAFSGRIVVACCHEDVRSIAITHGCEAVLTTPDLPSGTDRIYEAYVKCGATEDIIINLQGDMAIFPEQLIGKTLAAFDHMPIDVATAVCPMDIDQINDPSAVKVAFDQIGPDSPFGRALYFSRTPIPHGATAFYKHIGIYMYRKKALLEFVNAPVSSLEATEKLEQLRGLSLSHRYGAALVSGDYYSVDTINDAIAVEKYNQKISI